MTDAIHKGASRGLKSKGEPVLKSAEKAWGALDTEIRIAKGEEEISESSKNTYL